MYLLSTAALLDATTGTHPTLWPWLRRIQLRDIHLSVISVGRVRHELESASVAPANAALLSTLRGMVAHARSARTLLGVDERVADTWSQLLRHQLPVLEPGGQSAELDDDNRLVVATAVEHRLELVEQVQPYHAMLGGHLKVHSY